MGFSRNGPDCQSSWKQHPHPIVFSPPQACSKVGALDWLGETNREGSGWAGLAPWEDREGGQHLRAESPFWGPETWESQLPRVQCRWERGPGRSELGTAQERGLPGRGICVVTPALLLVGETHTALKGWRPQGAVGAGELAPPSPTFKEQRLGWAQGIAGRWGPHPSGSWTWGAWRSGARGEMPLCVTA